MGLEVQTFVTKLSRFSQNSTICIYATAVDLRAVLCNITHSSTKEIILDLAIHCTCIYLNNLHLCNASITITGK